MLYTPLGLKPAARSRIDFDRARLGEAVAAVFDLNDPLRTNVQFTLGRHVMYADMTTIMTMAEEKSDMSGVAETIVAAWKAALAGRAPHSNWMREISEGVVMVPLMASMIRDDAPAKPAYLN